MSKCPFCSSSNIEKEEHCLDCNCWFKKSAGYRKKKMGSKKEWKPYCPPDEDAYKPSHRGTDDPLNT